MIVLRKYQDEAVDGLLKETYSLLQAAGGRHKLVFKAPTGAGKTVTMAAFLNKLCEELPEKWDLPKHKVAFIWIAPNQLHLQSFNALKSYFEELRSIKPIQFESVTDYKLKPNEVLFLNWQSINKNSNLYIKENEQEKTLINYINNARLDETEVIVILDEAHLFAARGKSAQELLQSIYAKIEIDVSATPLNDSDYRYIIKRAEVIKAEMIKQGVILNPLLDKTMQGNKSLNQVLLEQALKKREELRQAYSDLGITINPLLLIQLPNDTEKESAEDFAIKDEVETFLEAKNITATNHRLGVWLSNEKTNLDEIENSDSITDVLLFKQAIALGWDCPRAAVLLIFREIKQEVFTIQTVGRILRMPEQKHYPSKLLNYGYVYTNLSKDMIQVVRDDMDYIVQNRAVRIENYSNIELRSYFINTRLIRNRLGSRFRSCLYAAAEGYLGITMDIEKAAAKGITLYNNEQLLSKFVETNIDNIEIPLPKNVLLSGEIEAMQATEKVRFAKTQFELDILFRQFCRSHVGGYAKMDSAPVLELALKMLFEEYLEMDEFKAIKIILFAQNLPKWIEVIDRALQKHTDLLQKKAAKASKRIEESIWEVPPERIYNEHYVERPADLHALLPFYEFNTASNPEKDFTAFLEKNDKHLEWWYKNGDKNKDDFALTYEDTEKVFRGFYVDFVIKLKEGTIALFDTKTPASDPNFISKHNALIDYFAENSTSEKPLIGGIIVAQGTGKELIWKYSENKITSAKDTSGWVSFDPSMVTA
jgi:type III restriction enzyme